MSMNRKDQAQLVYGARVKRLGLTQTEFAEYLNENNSLTRSRFDQSTISKYEKGIYKVPAEVMLICNRFYEDDNFIAAYSIESVVRKIRALSSTENFDLLRSFDVILEQTMGRST